jgi:multidrug efflux pump subunit AcrA (membrane-fusion protein)
MTWLKHLLGETLRIVLPLVILAAGIGGLAVVVLNREPPAVAPEVEKIPVVETTVVRSFAGDLEFEVDGLVVPFREVSMAAEATGKIIYKDAQCKAGKYVHKGNVPALAGGAIGMLAAPGGVWAAAAFPPEHPWLATLLMEIDPRDYELEIQRLTSELRQAEANYTQNEVEIDNSKLLIKLAQVQLDLQMENYKSTRDLFERGAVSSATMREATDKKVMAENALQVMQSQFNVQEVKRAGLKDAQTIVKDRLDKARLDLERTRIWAPLDGKVVQCDVEQGGYVQKGSMLIVLEDTSAVEVRSNLTTGMMTWLWQQPGADGINGYSGEAQPQQLPAAKVKAVYKLQGLEFLWDGVLSHYDGAGVDKTTHTIPCRILIADPSAVSMTRSGPAESEMDVMPSIHPPTLMRNMYVKVRIYLRPRIPLLEVAEQAVKPGNVVWRVRDGKLDMVPVKIAQIREGSVLISAASSALREGDRLVLTPIAFATDGVKIREKNTP